MTHDTRAGILGDPAAIIRAVSAAFGKLDPRRMILSPVMFTIEVGAVLTSMLAVARAAGETAPLLFTIGAVQSANWSLFQGTNTALSTQIFGNANSPFLPAQDRAFGAALTLILIVFLATAVARVVTIVYSRRTSGAA